jgi:Polyketide cyclase / dehydrase and lipid transport
MTRFTLEPVDESFLETASQRLVRTFEISRSAQQVWEKLVADGTLAWCRVLGAGATWTSPRPFGVGTTRRIKAAGLIIVEERYFRWEEGARKSFYVERCNLPLFKRFAEDYLVEETSPSSCRFTWTVAVEPSAIGRPGNPVNALITRSLFNDTAKHFGAR